MTILSRNIPAFAWFAGFIFMTTSVYGQWNTVTLSSGTMVTGTLNEANASSGTARIDLSNGGFVSIARDLVKSNVTVRPELVKYKLRAALAPDTVESHLELAQWCNQNGLSPEALRHYQRILDLDSENETAHKALQHVNENGVWLAQTQKERMEQKGYTRFGGRTITIQERQLENQRILFKDQVSSARKELKSLYKNVVAGRGDARETLRRTKSTAMLSPLSELFQKEQNTDLRVLLAQAIGSIGTPAAMMELGKISLSDSNEGVRVAALDAIRRKTLAVPAAIEYYKRFLASEDNKQVNLAGFALGYLRAKTAVPALINALVTEHKETIIVGTDKTGGTFGSDGSLRGFSAGNSAQKKVIVKAISNEQVHKALVDIVAVNWQPSADFRYDQPAWQKWYRNLEKAMEFNSRRDWD